MRAAYFVLSIYVCICWGEGTSGCLKDVRPHDGATLLQTSHMQPAAHDVLSAVSSSSALSQRETKDTDGGSCGLKEFFLQHTEGPGIFKWVHYFPIYEEHFGRFCRGSDQITMAEIGIQSGGSMLMWSHAFGQKLKLLVGMDINKATKSWEQLGSNIRVEIGSQGDPNFLKNITTTYPEGFDILVDDGSHVPEHQFATFVHMWSAIRPGGVYLIEDVHGINPLLGWILNGHKTASAEMEGWYFPGGKVGAPDEVSEIEGNNLGHWAGFWSGNASRVQNEVESIKIYPYVLAMTKRKAPLDLRSQMQGTQWIPMGEAYKSIKVAT